MRILLDTCISAHALEVLSNAGHDVEWTGELPQDPGDEAILSYAFASQRTLVTLDKDFGELVVL